MGQNTSNAHVQSPALRLLAAWCDAANAEPAPDLTTMDAIGPRLIAAADACGESDLLATCMAETRSLAGTAAASIRAAREVHGPDRLITLSLQAAVAPLSGRTDLEEPTFVRARRALRESVARVAKLGPLLESAWRPAAEPGDLITHVEASTLLRCDPKTVKRRVAGGELTDHGGLVSRGEVLANRGSLVRRRHGNPNQRGFSAS